MVSWSLFIKESCIDNKLIFFISQDHLLEIFLPYMLWQWPIFLTIGWIRRIFCLIIFSLFLQKNNKIGQVYKGESYDWTRSMLSRRCSFCPSSSSSKYIFHSLLLQSVVVMLCSFLLRAKGFFSDCDSLTNTSLSQSSWTFDISTVKGHTITLVGCTRTLTNTLLFTYN